METDPGVGADLVRVLVVDDHQMMAEGVAAALDAQPDLACTGIAGSLAEARAMLVAVTPDVVLLDHQLPDGLGVELVAEVVASHPSIAVVMLTSSTASRVLLDAVHEGATGFVPKSHGLAEVVQATRSAARGEPAFAPEVLTGMLPRLTERRRSRALTDREQEVLDLVAQGWTNAAIAAHLGLSEYTVRNHVARMSRRMGAHSKLELLSVAHRRGLVEAGASGGTDAPPPG